MEKRKDGRARRACEDIIKSESEGPKIELSKMRFQVMKQFGRIAKWAALAFCVAFIAIQFVPVSRTNPAVQRDFRGSTEMVSVLRRACYDCHSNETVWPWYSRVAPLSWVIAHDVNEGRSVLNFSTWDQLSPQKQAEAMKESWEEVAEGKMPTWYYVALHPEARLSANDQSVLRTWSLPSDVMRNPREDDD